MQYKPIKNYHVENVVFRKDFILGVISSFFHYFTQLILILNFQKLTIGSLKMWRIRFGNRLKCLNQKNFKEALVTIIKKLHKNKLKTIFILKAQFENIFWWHILELF
jgi:hypothetical protein